MIEVNRTFVLLTVPGLVLTGCAAPAVLPAASQARWHRVDSRTEDPVALRDAFAVCRRSAASTKVPRREMDACMLRFWYVWVSPSKPGAPRDTVTSSRDPATSAAAP